MEIYNNYLSAIESVLDESKTTSEEKEKVLTIFKDYQSNFDKFIKALFAICVVALFAVSYYICYVIVTYVLNAEMDLMQKEILLPIDRSINAITISVLLGATVVQTGAAFFVITKFLFPSSKPDYHQAQSSSQ